jgi:23S rRNA maturation-related 3'-5' exoribonuclease YhaM
MPTIKQFILFFVFGLREQIYTLNKLTYNIHLIPLLRKDEAYNLIIISYDFKILESENLVY